MQRGGCLAGPPSPSLKRLHLHVLLDYLPGPRFVLVVVRCRRRRGSGLRETLADDDGHDVGNATMLLLQGGVEVYAPFP
jgi:hypothetical protein